MKSSAFCAAVALILPLSAVAQSLPQKKADLEEALRVQQFICSGIADVSARGATEYSNRDLARCREALDSQRTEYQRFMAEYASARTATVATTAVAAPARTRTADAAH